VGYLSEDPADLPAIVGLLLVDGPGTLFAGVDGFL